MPYHNLTKAELGLVRKLISDHAASWFKLPNHCYSLQLQDILAKIKDMIHNYDYECPHEETGWAGDQKVCYDCGHMIWD